MCISPYCEKKKRSRRENSVPFASRLNKKKYRIGVEKATLKLRRLPTLWLGNFKVLLSQENKSMPTYLLHFILPFSVPDLQIVYFLNAFQMKTEKCLFMRYISLTAIWRVYFHPAKFDNFKDEKMSDYKTVSVAQSKHLLDRLLLRAFF